MSLFSHPRQ
jgi:3-dehydroquinate dehydratase-2